MDIEQARFNMIEQQIRTWEVLDQDVLDALTVVRRERFVPSAYRAMAFADMQIPLRIDGIVTNERMFEPKVEARLLQALRVRRHESVIEVGAGSGYMAALLALHARRVQTLELRPELANFARANLEANGVLNCEVRERDGAELILDETVSADVILLSGAVAVLPQQLLARLNPGGRLAAIVGEAPVMSAVLVTLSSDRQPITTRLFETLVRPLAGFPVPERFHF